MNPWDGAPLGRLLAPTLVVLALIWILPGAMGRRRPATRYLIVGVIGVCLLRYWAWRTTHTLVLGQGPVRAAWSIGCFVIELLALWDTGLLLVTFLRTSDHRQRADAWAQGFKAADPASLPWVDVLIPTYNEDLDVLEKTLVGALSLDWPNTRVFVLDDGRRAWLRDYCARMGAGYMTRPDNRGAKAGNINHALAHTTSEFVAIFDADFIPQRDFLMRTMGFFEDPSVGIVQTPHVFYNHDPMQTNLGMRQTLPDDQRFFFESIMPSRDAWGAAFCCGSNSVTRRAAFDAVGGGLPEGSITEDMFLTLVTMRAGYKTRYLCERLAYGRAPDSVSAFFIQRQRWAQGAIQILYQRSGPLGPGMSLMHRLLFLPTHWVTNGALCLTILAAPVVYLLTGLRPVQNVDTAASLYFILPTILAIIGGLTAFSEGKFHPLAAQVLNTFQAFRLVPSTLATVFNPQGRSFKVTPKGATGGEFDRAVFLSCATLIALTVLGLAMNLTLEWRQVADMHEVMLLGFWCSLNIVVLFLVSLLCLQVPVRRLEERFAVREPLLVQADGGPPVTLMSVNISQSGAALESAADGPSSAWQAGDRLRVFISSVGWLPAQVARSSPKLIGIRFEHAGLIERDLLIRKLFTSGLTTVVESAGLADVTLGLLQRIWTADVRLRPAIPAEALAEPTPEAPVPPPRLPAASLVVPPAEHSRRIIEAAALVERAA